MRMVQIPEITGKLFLAGMPGRYASLENDFRAVHEHGVDAIISLTSLDEIESKSPGYFAAIREGRMPCPRREYPIEDFGTPADLNEFLGFVSTAAQDLREGRNLLVHCGAGIGRTGMFAASLLVALGLPLDEAFRRVEEAGSGPETVAQREVVKRAAQVR